MVRKYIKKINNFIQWTKKWHLGHCIFISDMFICLICIFSEMPIMTVDRLLEYLFSANILLFYPAVLIVGTILAILIAVTKFIKKYPVYVESKFLLKNKTYNIVYILNWLYVCLAFFIICFSLICTINSNDIDKLYRAVGIALAFLMTGLIIFAISLTVYIILLLILTKFQKDTLIKQEPLPFRK